MTAQKHLNNHIDLSVIDELIGKDDIIGKNKIINLFIEHASPTIKNIIATTEQKNYLKVKSLAHKLKSSARSSGALLLGDTAEKIQGIEFNSTNANIALKLSQQLMSLMDEYIQFVQEIRTDSPTVSTPSSNSINECSPVILIVDDDPVSLAVFQSNIKALQVKTIAVTSGKEALKAAKKQNIALILLDIEMSDINGLEVANLLAKNDITAQIPIIFITEKCENTFMDAVDYSNLSIDYMLKPANQHIIKSKISLFVKLFQQKQELGILNDQLGILNDQLALNNNALEIEISKRKEAEKNLYYRAHYDQLTGIANRTLFMDKALSAFKSSKQNKQNLAILFLDLDGFKLVNDHQGHDAGDDVLINVAQYFSSCLQDSDLLGRMGGDEFAIMLPNMEQLAILKITDQLLKLSNQPFNQQQANPITVSIGISQNPAKANNINDMLIQADRAMYESKQKGKNQFTLY